MILFLCPLKVRQEACRMTLKSRLQQLIKAVISILTTAGKKNVKVFAAASEYFLFMSLVPILMLLVSLIRYLPINQADIVHLFVGTVPESVVSVIHTIVESIYRDGETATAISLLLMLYSASAAMRPLMKGLDAVYGDERKDSTPLFFLRSIIYLAILVLVIILSIIILVSGEYLLRYLNTNFPNSSLISLMISCADLLRYFAMFCVLTFGLVLLYSRVPARKRKPSDQWPGAILCALAWAIFSWGFSFYFSVVNKFGAYGYIGTILVTMMWGYYCLIFLLYGGCINAYLENRPNSPS